MTDYTSGDYQEAVRQLVNREIVYCVSSLVYELAQDERHMEDLYPVLNRDDFETPAFDIGWRIESYGDEWRCIHKDHADRLFNDCTETDAWRELCELENIEPFQVEAYEHWIVSDWLADKLEAKGEMVLRDFMGLTIWGRTCTGQAILLDSVICDIYNDLHRKAA